MHTFIQVLVSIAGLDVRAELVPQAMQFPLQWVEARHGGSEEARLDDANFNSEVVNVPPRYKMFTNQIIFFVFN